MYTEPAGLGECYRGCNPPTQALPLVETVILGPGSSILGRKVYNVGSHIPSELFLGIRPRESFIKRSQDFANFSHYTLM